MTISSSGVSAVVFATFVLATGWLVSDYMPPPWPCEYATLSRHPKALALIAAARSACADGRAAASLDLDRIWPDDWRRLHLLGPYHGNHEVVRRLGFELEIMACTRSRNADEWTQAVVENRGGGLDTFDLPSHLMAGRPRDLAAGAGRLEVRCEAVAEAPTGPGRAP